MESAIADVALVDGVQCTANHAVTDSTVPCPNPTTGPPVDTRTLRTAPRRCRSSDRQRGNTRTVSRAVAVDNTAPGSPQASAWRAEPAGERERVPTVVAQPARARTRLFKRSGRGLPARDPARDPLGCPTTTYRTTTAGLRRSASPDPASGGTRVAPRCRRQREFERPPRKRCFASTTLRRRSRSDSSSRAAGCRPRATPTRRASPLAVREVLLRRRGSLVGEPPVTPERDGFSASSTTSAFRTVSTSYGAGGRSGRQRTVDGQARRRDAGAARAAAADQDAASVGRPKTVRARRRGGKRRYRIVLIETPRSAPAERSRCAGRLTSPGGNPLAGRRSRWRSGRRSPERRGGRSRLSHEPDGRFTFKALRGPAGRSASASAAGHDPGPDRARQARRPSVDYAAASRSSVVNGEDVTFRDASEARRSRPPAS